MCTITIKTKKETALLFNQEMVLATKAGLKLKTRRLIQPQPPEGATYFGEGMVSLNSCMEKEDALWDKVGFVWEEKPGAEVIKFWPKEDDLYCPFGHVGDLIWVRETFYQYGHWVTNGKTKAGKPKFKFIPDQLFSEVRFSDNPPAVIRKNTFRKDGWYKRPSIHIPRAAARLLLEITAVRPERLQDLSEEDAIAEGVESIEGIKGPIYFNYLTMEFGFKSAKISFESLWVSLYGSESWESNPWVWVIDYKVVEGGSAK